MCSILSHHYSGLARPADLLREMSCHTESFQHKPHHFRRVSTTPASVGKPGADARPAKIRRLNPDSDPRRGSIEGNRSRIDLEGANGIVAPALNSITYSI